MWRSYSLLLLALLTPLSVAAQQQATPSAGQRVLVSHRCKVVLQSVVIECADTLQPRSATGRLIAINGDVLRIGTTSRDELAIPISYVDEWFLSASRRNELRNGAILGFIGGGLIGAAIGSQLDFCLLSCGPATAFGLMVGAPAGLLIGAVVGASIRSETWVPLSTSELRMMPDALTNRLRIGFHVAL